MRKRAKLVFFGRVSTEGAFSVSVWLQWIIAVGLQSPRGSNTVNQRPFCPGSLQSWTGTFVTGGVTVLWFYETVGEKSSASLLALFSHLSTLLPKPSKLYLCIYSDIKLKEIWRFCRELWKLSAKLWTTLQSVQLAIVFGSSLFGELPLCLLVKNTITLTSVLKCPFFNQ